jgi:hypothetical protein
MALQFQNSSRFFELHCSTGLTDWDMDEEMKLTTTTDQFFQGKMALCYDGRHFYTAKHNWQFHCLACVNRFLDSLE